MTAREDRYGVTATHEGRFAGWCEVRVQAGQLMVKRGRVVESRPPSARVVTGPASISPCTDDPDVLRALARALEAAAALLELRQAAHTTALEAYP